MKTFKQYLEEAGKGPPKYMKVDASSTEGEVMTSKGIPRGFIANPKATEVSRDGTVHVGDEAKIKALENMKPGRNEKSTYHALLHPEGKGAIIFRPNVSHGAMHELIGKQHPEHFIKGAVHATIRVSPKSHEPTEIIPHGEISDDAILKNKHLKVFGNVDVKKED